MARKGAMAKNPPLRGAARKEFRAAQREAVASGGPMPTQDKFRPRPQLQSQPQTQPQQQSYDQARQAAPGAAQQAIQQQPAPDQGGQMPPDKMYRFPQPAGGQGATLGAAMGNVAGSRSEGSPVFNAFPGNNPANLNDANIGRFDNMRYPGGSATFNENPNDMARPAVMPDNYSNQQQQQFLQALQQARQGGQVQDGMFRSPGVPMRNIPGIEPAIQPGAYMPQMRRR